MHVPVLLIAWLSRVAHSCDCGGVALRLIQALCDLSARHRTTQLPRTCHPFWPHSIVFGGQRLGPPPCPCSCSEACLNTTAAQQHVHDLQATRQLRMHKLYKTCVAAVTYLWCCCVCRATGARCHSCPLRLNMHACCYHPKRMSAAQLPCQGRASQSYVRRDAFRSWSIQTSPFVAFGGVGTCGGTAVF